MKQLVYPDLTTVGNVGWCLSFVEDAYGTPHLGATATDAWNATRTPHRDRNLPQDVQVPVWWSYYENGLNFGHVAINVPGQGVLSSPYKANGTQQWFKDIDECGRVMGCQAFLGWSEDLAGVKLIQGDNMSTIATPDIVDSLAHAYLNDSLANNPGLQFYVGQNVEDVITTFNTAQERADFLKAVEAKDAEIVDLKNQVKNASGGPLDQATKDQIANTDTNVSWIKSFLSKIFK